MSARQRLIGITGPAGAGKTTAGALLAGEMGWSLAGFADPIRAAVLALVPWWDPWHLTAAGKDLRQAVRLSPTEVFEAMQAHLRNAGLEALADGAAASADLDAETWGAVFELIPDWLPESHRANPTESIVPLTPRHALRIFGDLGRGQDPALYIHALASRVQFRSGSAGTCILVHDVRMPAEAEWIREQGGTLVHITRPGIVFSRAHGTEYGVRPDATDLVIANDGDTRQLRARLLSDLISILWRAA